MLPDTQTHGMFRMFIKSPSCSSHALICVPGVSDGTLNKFVDISCAMLSLIEGQTVLFVHFVTLVSPRGTWKSKKTILS